MDIKFKGKRVDNGEWAEGFYWIEETRNANKHHIYTFEKKGSTDLIRITGNFEVDPATVEIVTPMYKAAEDMYEALWALVDAINEAHISSSIINDALTLTRQALAKAEGSK